MRWRRVLLVGGALAALRFAAFLVVWLFASVDAQWQLTYLPFLVIDFPVSLAYRFFPLPWPEALVGPIWWFCLPVLVSLAFSAARQRRNVSGAA